VKTPFALVALAVLLILPARAAKVDFSPFAGKYGSSYLFQLSGGGVPAAGDIDVRVKVPRNGAKATITFKGTVTSAGTPILVNGRLILTGNGRVKATSILMGLYGLGPTRRARFKGRRNAFNFTLVTRPDATFSDLPFHSTMRYTLRFKRDSFSLRGTGSINDAPVTVTVDIEGHR